MTPKTVIQGTTITVVVEVEARVKAAVKGTVEAAVKAEGIKGEGVSLVVGAGKQGQADPKARQATRLLMFASQ